MNDNGKGDTPRPKTVSQEKWAENWDKIFNKQTYNEWLEQQKCKKQEK